MNQATKFVVQAEHHAAKQPRTSHFSGEKIYTQSDAGTTK